MIRLIAALLLLAPTTVQAQKQKDCLDGQLLSAVMLGIAPDMVQAAADRCRSMLPAGAFLPMRSRAMADRIRAELGDTSASIAALVKDMTGIDASQALDASTITTLFSSPIRDDIAKMDAQDCAAVDQLLAGLEPLPAARLKQVIAGFLTLGSKGDKDMKLCPAT